MNENIYTINEFDYSYFNNLKLLPRKKGNRKKKYYDCVCAFDIETTTIDKYSQAIMYIWQFQVDDYATVVGRTWEEFKSFMAIINSYLSEDAKLVILVHNLSFEFQWLKSVLPVDEIFAMDDRKVLYFRSYSFEFRCTYLHSNMALEKYIEKVGGQYHKIKGFDYSKKRYPWTKLSDKELLYCINDVRGLVDAYKREMALDGDDLYSIPYTSTGYVRRVFKKALAPKKHIIRKYLPNREVFEGLRRAFRGGNTHAHRGNSNRLLKNVYSYDISSSYPGVLLTEEYPTTFIHRPTIKFEQDLRQGRACLIHIYLEDVKLLDDNFGCPYLAAGKVDNLKKGVLDNGRVLSCESCITWLTEIDFSILLKEYSFKYQILDLYSAFKKPLPDEFKKVLLDMYHKKTLLKGSDDDYSYNKYKNMINSAFGMMVQNPIKPNYIFKEGELVINEEETIDELMIKYQKDGWLPYQWGVWCTAYARLKLEEGIQSIPYEAFVYADTDSVKFLGDYGYRIEKLNENYIHDEYNATDRNGKNHYIGIYEFDGFYKKFKTMGAKKYCYVDDKGLHVTISGVNKEKGAIELKNINNFKEGYIFKEAGGDMAVYNDFPEPNRCRINGHDINIISNIAILPSTYTLGLAPDYERLLRLLSTTDIRFSLHYER